MCPVSLAWICQEVFLTNVWNALFSRVKHLVLAPLLKPAPRLAKMECTGFAWVEVAPAVHISES